MVDRVQPAIDLKSLVANPTQKKSDVVESAERLSRRPIFNFIISKDTTTKQPCVAESGAERREPSGEPLNSSHSEAAYAAGKNLVVSQRTPCGPLEG